MVPGLDAGTTGPDAGVNPPELTGGCSCISGPSALWLAAGLVALVRRRRRA
jgi:MYXO-CTERM domain-containing protein